MLMDFAELRKFTIYKNGYKERSKTIVLFWKVCKEFTEAQRILLIRFVTSCSRPPLLGFKHLNPKFTIQRIEGIEKLPSSSTCFNILKLPDYKSKKVLKGKLLKAITMATGFYIS